VLSGIGCDERWIRKSVMSQHVFLIGFMGSGKTYWGERLSAALQKPFVDLDRLIEQGEGETITGLFHRLGEEAFRVLERRYLHQLAHHICAVVATGGGTPCFFDNLEWMRAHGATLFLDVPFDILAERLDSLRIGRPLLAGADRRAVEQLWEARRPFYTQAEWTVRFTQGDEAAFWEALYSTAQTALQKRPGTPD
jgi:shikimate kinase